MNNLTPQYDEETQTKIGLIGMTFTLLLALAFIVLKVAAVGAIASWSWIWVLSPLWIPFGLGLLLAILGVKGPGQ